MDRLSSKAAALLPFTLQPLQAQKLYLSAAYQIAQAISQGRWDPGDKLPPERELAEMLNVSRTTVRQAMAALEALTVIQIRSGVGAFIKPEALKVIAEEIVSEMVTLGDPLLLVDARAILEPGIAGLAAQNREAPDLAHLERYVQGMDAINTGGISPREFIDADIEFHMAIGAATHNPPAIMLVMELVRWMRQRVWLTGAYLIVSKRGPQYQADHRAILAAITQQDSEAAKSQMAEHLAGIAANLRSFSQISEEA